MSIIGDNIQRFRKLRGLTQEELAKLMGYKSKSTINKIELGVNDVPHKKIAKFAEVLGATPAEIVGWETPALTSGGNMFWERFVQLCNGKNTTPTAVINFLGLSRGSVTMWKKGAIPRDTALSKIADYFGVSTDYLLGKEDAPSRGDVTFTPKEAELLRRIQELDDKQSEKLIEYMEFLLQQRKKKQE